MTGPYDDLLHLPHHSSPIRPPMSRTDRAAQFAPFAALTGYDAAIAEAARLTDQMPQLDEDAKADLDRKLQILLSRIREQPAVTVIWFQPDERKAGGAVLTVTGALKQIDSVQRILLLTDETSIPLEHILDLQNPLLQAPFEC